MISNTHWHTWIQTVRVSPSLSESLGVRCWARCAPFGPFIWCLHEDFNRFLLNHFHTNQTVCNATEKKTFSSKFVPYKSTSHAFHCRSFSQCFQCINVGRLLHFIHLAIKLFILSLPCLPPFHTCKKLFISKRISYGRWRNYFRSWFWAAAPATPCTMRESQPKGKISVKLFTSLAYSLIVLFSFRLHAGILNIRDDITPSNEQ